MKILITGASGFVGTETARVAVMRGHDVYALVRPESDLYRLTSIAPQITILKCGHGSGEQLRTAIKDAAPECLIHAAWSGVMNNARFDRQQIDANILSSCDLVEYAASANVSTFIGIGSQAEYGLSNPMMETTCPAPTTLYGSSKLAAYYLTKQLAHQNALRHAWLRLFSTYGPNDNDGWLIPYLIGEFLAGRRPKTTEGNQKWDYLFITDVAKAIIAVAETSTAEGLFNLGSGTAHRIRDIVTLIRDLAAPDMDLKFGEVPYRPDQVMHMQADITRLCEATGWRPETSIQDGLKKTIEAYKRKSPR